MFIASSSSFSFLFLFEEKEKVCVVAMNSPATVCVRVSLIFKNVFFFFSSFFFVRFVVAHVRLHPLVCVADADHKFFPISFSLSLSVSSSFATEEDKSVRRKNKN